MAVEIYPPTSVESKVKECSFNIKLGIAIQDSTTLGMKAAQQAVVGNVPEMIKDLTEDIKSQLKSLSL